MARNDTSWAFGKEKLGKDIFEYYEDARVIDEAVYSFYKDHPKYFENFTKGYSLINSDQFCATLSYMYKATLIPSN